MTCEICERCSRESFKASASTVMERVRGLIHEGNVRRVVVEHEGKIVAEFPVTAGVVGAVIAPILAAIGALAAVLKDCTIHVERERSQSPAVQVTVPAHSNATDIA